MEFAEVVKAIKEKYYSIDSKSSPLFLLSVLFEEVGELAEAVRKNKLEEIGEELCDVLFMVISLANYYNIEIERKLVEKYLTGDPSSRWDLER
ncbi:MAG: nucleotide pyrophosphohydrolase [Archaeoglobales archaeon]|nr:nucleotide pyrophosphohydrolase [Archaeoglobi archaeon]NHW23062.1 nucleotide pyrophosphohydrolase [Archaeoglobales archaeon]